MRSSVLVVDDHEGFRTEARAVLEADGFVVVGEVATAADAVSAAGELRPEVVVLDIGLPDLSGLDVVDRIRDTSPGSLIVLVSGRRGADYGSRIARSGADAFLDKASLAPGSLRAVLRQAGPG